MRDISRRDFLKGSVAAAAALGLTGIAPAFAEEAKTEEKEKLAKQEAAAAEGKAKRKKSKKNKDDTFED